MPTNTKRPIVDRLPLRSTLAEYVKVGGQRLRADEAATVVTFQLFYYDARQRAARQARVAGRTR